MLLLDAKKLMINNVPPKESWLQKNRGTRTLNTDTQLGVTSLELLFSMIISIPILLALTMALKTAGRELVAVKSDLQKTQAQLRLHAFMRKAIDDLDSHTLPILPRVHHSGILTFTDKTKNQVMHSSPFLLPDQRSDALTYFEPDILSTMSILKSDYRDGGINFFICSRWGGSLQRADYHSYLLVFMEGTNEYLRHPNDVLHTNEKLPPDTPPNCTQILLQKSSRSMIADAANFNEQFAYYLVPIRSIYSIYVDKKNRLRYLAHKGETNIENQPLIDNFGGLSINSENNSQTAIQVDFRPASNKTRKLRFSSAIYRLPLIDFITLRP